MTLPDAMIALRPWIQRNERYCWQPILREGDGSCISSKFGGLPWLAPNEEGPSCKGCQQPLKLFLQLNLSELPSELGNCFGTGLLQLFYCSHSDGRCEGDDGTQPFVDIISNVRIVSVGDEAGIHQNENRSPAKTIVGWQRSVDHPDPAEYSGLGLNIDYHFKTVPFRPTELRCEDLGVFFSGIEHVKALHRTAPCLSGHKLAGWPRWIPTVGSRYLCCPECGNRMRHMFQVGSTMAMFGGDGFGHIMQCEAHKRIVALRWFMDFGS